MLGLLNLGTVELRERAAKDLLHFQPYASFQRQIDVRPFGHAASTSHARLGAHLYWENKLDVFDIKGETVPVGVTAFPDELYQAPRSWSEKAYPKLVYYKKHDIGGHFEYGSDRSCFPKTFAGRSVMCAKLSIRSEILRFVPSAPKE